VLGAVVNLFGRVRSDQGRTEMKVRSEREFSFAAKADTLRPGLDVGRDLMTMLKRRRAAAALLWAGLLGKQ
jgi:hypothetical protein